MALNCGELAKLVSDLVKMYSAAGIEESIRRNSHMNDLKASQPYDSALAEAVLVDFANFMVYRSCSGDLGLYTRDLRESKP